MNLLITLTITSSPPDGTAALAQRISDDMARQYHQTRIIRISYLVEQFSLLAAAYRAPAKMKKHP